MEMFLSMKTIRAQHLGSFDVQMNSVCTKSKFWEEFEEGALQITRTLWKRGKDENFGTQMPIGTFPLKQKISHSLFGRKDAVADRRQPTWQNSVPALKVAVVPRDSGPTKGLCQCKRIRQGKMAEALSSRASAFLVLDSRAGKSPS